MNYPPVPQMDADHKYTYLGSPYPNVTSILQAVGITNYTWMPAAQKEAVFQRGSFAHKACELDDDGSLDWEELDEELRGYVLAWRAFKAELSVMGGVLLPDWTERKMVCVALGYCGTMDRMVELNGHTVPLDIKTGVITKACGIQLAAYDLARGACDGERWGVQLSKDGEYKLVKYTNKQDYAVWLAALKVYSFIKGAA